MTVRRGDLDKSQNGFNFTIEARLVMDLTVHKPLKIIEKYISMIG